MISDDLRERGYSVQRDFFTAAEVQVVSADIQTLNDKNEFTSASIGNNNKTREAHLVRNDKTYWVDTFSPSDAQNIILSALERIRLECNSSLFLGLFDFEGHYSIYPPQAYYRKHFDSFSDDNARVLTIVAYFNNDWKVGDGGELLLHTSPTVLIEPIAGSLALFMSREIEHEVLETNVTRQSFSGWFKKAR